ncbi:MAG: hypothetical protein E7073_05805 [Bacteroidales bacterium]|nr:hypothetical protein [Bacteroidales bacterium]
MITKSFFFFILMWAKIYIFSIPLVFLRFFYRSQRKKSVRGCSAYRAVYALFCNILTINCFFGCLGGCSANVKIWLAVFAWAHYADFVFFSARCGSAGSPTKRNAMEPKRRRKIKLPFGTSAWFDYAHQPPLSDRNGAVFCRDGACTV